MADYVSLPMRRLASLVRKYVHHCHMKLVERESFIVHLIQNTTQVLMSGVSQIYCISSLILFLI